MAQQQIPPLLHLAVRWSHSSTNRADRWTCIQDFSKVCDAYHDRELCPANVDTLVNAAVARMGKTHLPKQFADFVLDYKADTWHVIVTNDIPQLQAQLQAAQTQIQALQGLQVPQAPNVAMQAQIVTLQAQVVAAQTQIGNLQTDIVTRTNRIGALEAQIAAQPAQNPLAEAIYGPPGQIPDAVAHREEVTIEVTNAQQSQYLLSMDSLVGGMADMIRNRVIDSLPGRLRAWLQVAEQRGRLAIRALDT